MLKHVIIFLVIFAGALALHPDTGLNIFEMIERHGYTYERHPVITEDGYILEMHRIPHGLNNAGEPNKPPVLIMHGLLSSSADWVNIGPESSIAYMLANLGYDVWLGNARGNTWGRNHTIYDPDNDAEQFWNFSWNEIGKYDLPAKIDYILEATGQEKLFYIAHSQGTTAFFVMTSTKPEYNDKIRLMSAMGPAVFMNNMDHPFLPGLAENEEQLEQWAVNNSLYEFLPSTELIEALGKTFCDDNAPTQQMCENIIFLICGFDSEQLNGTLLPVIATNAPAGASSKQLLHYAQSIKDGFFRQWDFHDDLKNMEAYGQTTPPDYNLEKVTAPVSLHYGKNDWLVSITDVNRLIAALPNVVFDKLIDYEMFNHIDFLWATDVVDMVYNDVIAVMSNY